MPRKGLKCIVEVTIHAVTCPGVRLPVEHDLFLSICLLGHHIHTREIAPIFPLVIKEKFKFTKTFASCSDFQQLDNALQDEGVVLELVRSDKRCNKMVVLALYETCALDFLFPQPGLKPSYSCSENEALMEPTNDFPGILGPKVEFSTMSTIKETANPDLDCMKDKVCKIDDCIKLKCPCSLYNPKPSRNYSLYRSCPPNNYGSVCGKTDPCADVLSRRRARLAAETEICGSCMKPGKPICCPPCVSCPPRRSPPLRLSKCPPPCPSPPRCPPCSSPPRCPPIPRCPPPRSCSPAYCDTCNDDDDDDDNDDDCDEYECDDVCRPIFERNCSLFSDRLYNRCTTFPKNNNTGCGCGKSKCSPVRKRYLHVDNCKPGTKDTGNYSRFHS